MSIPHLNPTETILEVQSLKSASSSILLSRPASTQIFPLLVKLQVSQRVLNEYKKTKKLQAKGNLCSRITYLCYILLSIGCATSVMSIWYFHSYKEGKVLSEESERESTKSQSNFTACPDWNIVGDGYCDDQANVLECGFDFKDCCKMENDRSLCQDCICEISQFEKDSYYNDNCKDPCSLKHLGDGTCDLNYNHAKYYFDVGDCCLENLNCILRLENSTVNIGFVSIDQPCPENPCIQSNNFCVPEELGDGICQDHNNGPLCHYDMGDCCMVGRNVEHCCTCACKLNGVDFFNYLIENELSYDVTRESCY